MRLCHRPRRGKDASLTLILLRLLWYRQYRNYKVVYRRYAGLFFCVCVDANDNELAYLEAIHLFVEVLGGYMLVDLNFGHSYRPEAKVSLPLYFRRHSLFFLSHVRSDSFFGNVCELDLVFNFYKVYAILDEIFLAGEIEETSKNVVLNRLEQRECQGLECQKDSSVVLTSYFPLTSVERLE